MKKNNWKLSAFAVLLILAACSQKTPEQKVANAQAKPAATAKSDASTTKTDTAPKVSSSKVTIDSRLQEDFKQAAKVADGAFANNPKNYQAGQHFDIFDSSKGLYDPVDGKIEVVEFFAAGCPACFNAEPMMQALKERLGDDVNFIQVPVTFDPYFEHLARGQFAAEALGVDDITKIKMFESIHLKQNRLQTPNAMAAFYSDYGIDKEEFFKSYNSFSVNTRMNKAREMASKYGVGGVPTLVVNGKYRSGSRKAGTYVKWVQIIDQLVDQERNAAP